MAKISALHRQIVTAALLAGIVVTAPAAQAATTIDFQDINAGSGIAVSNGYAGYNWNNVYAVNGITSGYPYGAAVTNSAPNVAVNGNGNTAGFSSSTAFSLTSINFTGATYNESANNPVTTGTVTVDGFNSLGHQTEMSSFTVSTSGPTTETFDWSNLSDVTISTNNLTFVLFGDIVVGNSPISPVPLPGALPLFASGLAGAGLLARRRARRRDRA